MKTFTICILDNVFTDLQIEEYAINELGGNIVFLGDCTDAEVHLALTEADGIITSLREVTASMIHSAKNCKVISRMGVGYNNINVTTATKQGIFVCNVPDYCIDEVSNHAFTMMMSLGRKLHLANAMVHRGIWDVNQLMPIQDFRNSTLGLLAFGNIAQALAKKAKILGMRVIASDPFASPEIAENLGVSLVDMETLLAESDFLSLHAPLFPETHHIINATALSKMKKTAYLINTSRGSLIDEVALYDALKHQKIAGAGLDVLEEEPIQKTNPLLELDQILLSPHSAYYSVDSNDTLRKRTATQTALGAMGNIPPNVVNKTLL